jgi:hypothetical protein
MKQQITKLLRYSERATFYPNYIMLVLLQDGPWYTCSVPVDQALAPAGGPMAVGQGPGFPSKRT